MAKSGAQTRWEVPEKKLSHREILRKSETSLKFLVKSVYDLFPTPANKKTWFGEDESCKRCGEYGLHIFYLDAELHCPKEEKRRYYEVLREMAEIVDRRRESHNKETRSPEKRTSFVKEKRRHLEGRVANILTWMVQVIGR